MDGSDTRTNMLLKAREPITEDDIQVTLTYSYEALRSDTKADLDHFFEMIEVARRRRSTSCNCIPGAFRAD